MYDKGPLVVSLAGELTWRNADSVKSRLSLYLQQGYSSLVLNLESLEHVDSTGLAVLIFLSRRIHSFGGTLLLVNVCQPVLKVINQAQLLDKLPCVPKGTAGMRTVGVPAGEAPLRVHTMSLDRNPSSMEKARKYFSDMLAMLALPSATAYDLVLALGEALGNAYDHGRGSEGEEGDVSATISVYSDRVVFEVNDCGEGISFREGDELPRPTNERGRGIRLMLMLADSITISPRETGKGTCVRLIKMINKARAK